MKVDVRVPEIDLVIKTLAELRTEIDGLRTSVNPSRHWWDLNSAATAKGVSASTLRARPWLQPNGGNEDGILNGRKMWKWETIRRWLDLTDADLEAKR